jgi:hypothetical protein
MSKFCATRTTQFQYQIVHDYFIVDIFFNSNEVLREAGIIITIRAADFGQCIFDVFSLLKRLFFRAGVGKTCSLDETCS